MALALTAGFTADGGTGRREYSFGGSHGVSGGSSSSSCSVSGCVCSGGCTAIARNGLAGTDGNGDPGNERESRHALHGSGSHAWDAVQVQSCVPLRQTDSKRAVRSMGLWLAIEVVTEVVGPVTDG